MYVWLHSSSPPQHIANVPESQVRSVDKLKTFVDQVNARRLINIKWAGVFEDNHANLSVHMFWDLDKASAYVARNGSPIISTKD